MLTRKEYDEVSDLVLALEGLSESEFQEVQHYLRQLRDLHRLPVLTWRERFFAFCHGYLPKRD